MSDLEKNELLALSPDINFHVAVNALYSLPQDFIENHFGGIFPVLNDALLLLLNQPAQPAEASLDQKLRFIYDNYIPFVKDQLHKDAITKHVAGLIGLTDEVTSVLIKDDLPLVIDSMPVRGFLAEYFSDTSFTDALLAVQRIDSEINFDWSAGTPDPLMPANNYSIRWQALLVPPSSGEYTIIVTVKDANNTFKLFIDEVMILDNISSGIITSFEVRAMVNASQMQKLKLEYIETTGNAGISLSWKTATTAPSFINAAALMPVSVMDDFYTTNKTYHRAGKFITGFKLTETEAAHFINFKTNFANIDFAHITLEHWKRINDYVQLRNSVPQLQASLINVFTAANIIQPVPLVPVVTDLLYLATGWDHATLSYLISTYYSLPYNKFQNEIEIIKIYKAVSFSVKTGLPVHILAQWAAPETDFANLKAIADMVKNAVKAKYEEADWLKLAGDLSDKIRENQKQALISYLLTKPDLIGWGVTDADSLFEYFLIDVQMGACMDTSRIVQANEAVRMFVNRCLLNLESDKGTGVQIGVSPDAIDRDRWEWMKAYRVWEANHKVFLYPENWLEPEWRDDRSPFFKELESELTQNDITDRSVETGFRNYLTKLNTVANLDVCGTYQENYQQNNKLKLLHVFGKTHTSPYQFFYRTCNEFWKWSAWEKVQVDIRMTEDGDNSGVHLTPVAWKGRMFIFWIEFIEKQKQNGNQDNSKSIKQISDSSLSDLKAEKYFETRLAWSENIDGKWSPKQLTKEFIVIVAGLPGENPHKSIHLTSEITATELQLKITYNWSDHSENTWKDAWVFKAKFLLSDIQSKIVIDLGESYGSKHESSLRYSFNYEKQHLHSWLKFWGNIYLKKSVSHNLVFSNNMLEKEADVNAPFFYHDAYRAYFVKPFVPIKPTTTLTTPQLYAPSALNTMSQAIYGAPETPTISQSTGLAPGTYMLANASAVVSAFAWSTGIVSDAINNTPIFKKEFGFYTFYHPYSSQFVTNLNRGGIKGLMDSDTLIDPVSQQLTYNDQGATFINNYDPDFLQAVTKAPASEEYKTSQAYTYYKENICFDIYGANSIYNWELFFHAPLYIATRLTKNGKYEEAMKWFHYIFDPTTDEMPLPGQTETSRYWKALPFKTTPAQTLEEWFVSIGLGINTNPSAENAIVGEWRKNPFKPFVVARNRPLAFMKNVVIKYVENLRLWGDSLFRMFTRESVNEALQLYVMADYILGPRPEFVPKRGVIKAETYDSLKGKLDDLSNALVEMENLFPYSSAVPVSTNNTPPSLMGIGRQLYFCIPANEKLMEHWDTIADRLFKIRHCMDIDGVERHLALFSPPIDPAMLINAAAQGLSLGSILSDLSSPPPVYRFTYLMQKANEFCNEVKSLGGNLLSALEKNDGEELGRLRSSHETAMLELMTAIKERQVLDARVGKEGLLKSRETAALRLEHYNGLLSSDGITIPAPPTLDAEVNSESQLPVDTGINKIKVDADESLVESNEKGVKIIPKEKEDLNLSEAAKWITSAAGLSEMVAGGLRLIPQFGGDFKPVGVGTGVTFGGIQLGGIASAMAGSFQSVSTFLTMQAAKAQKVAGYIRREQEWTLQANQAAREIIQLDKQITSADIKIQISQKELANHKQQIENTKQVEEYLKGKFTNQELYQWMKEQLFFVYKQSFNMAYDMAKKVELCYRYELGTPITNFIQYGYWDNSMQGLCAGEKLQFGLRQLEKSYIEENKRELELTKSISMALLNPLALQELRTMGKCSLIIPEELYDLDYQGHYFRRIRSASISLPCIAGPYTTVNCTLRLVKNTIRINTFMNDDKNYEHNNDGGVWTDDDRFRESNVPVKSIATSTGQRDSGMFELNFRDERYLPFEGAGAISEWQIELTRNPELRQFDYSTISDIILHISYTAREEGGSLREEGGSFRESAVVHLKNFLTNAAVSDTQPLMRMFSMKHEFPNEWHRFLYPVVATEDQLLKFTVTRDHFPFFTQGKAITVEKLEILIKANRAGSYKMLLSAIALGGDSINSVPPISPVPATSQDAIEITMPENAAFANMQKATVTSTTTGLNAEEIDIFLPMSMKFRHIADLHFHSIDTSPDEISEMFLVVHYALRQYI
jgi:hypothetical protein